MEMRSKKSVAIAKKALVITSVITAVFFGGLAVGWAAGTLFMA
jgi:hypothetical protein